MLRILSLFLFITKAYAEIDPALMLKLRQTIEPQIGKNTFGSVVGIYHQGQTEFLTLGQSHKDSIFKIASLTKTITSLMFSIAIDKGLVTNETTLAEIRPEWKNVKAGSITLLELATHRSGLMRLPCNFYYEDPANPYLDYTEEDLIESLSDDSLSSIEGCVIQGHPTATINYSNWGSALLGHAISVRAKKSYQEVLRDWITEPLKMNDTVLALSSKQKTRVVQGYDHNLKKTNPWDHNGMLGNGAILSTPRDMLTYAQAMLNPNQTSIASAILRVQKRQYEYVAYNWFITPADNIWHDGMSGGYSSLIKIYPKKDFAVLWLNDVERELKCIVEVIDNIPCDVN